MIQPIAFYGICGYGPGHKTSPGRLGWGIDKSGFGPYADEYIRPLLEQTACRRIMLHLPFWSLGASSPDIPLNAGALLRGTLPEVYASFFDTFSLLARAFSAEILVYLGAATQITGPEIITEAIEPVCQRKFTLVFDKASALTPMDHGFTVLPALAAAGVPVIIEQRPKRVQTPFYLMPTFTLQSELNRQEERGGEPSLIEFNKMVENIIGQDVSPPDRSFLDHEAWVADWCQGLMLSGFTPAPVCWSLVKRGQWSPLREIFGNPGEPATTEFIATSTSRERPGAGVA
ncbi:MAG: hypothetical protein AMXMBFR58_29830 [Phycisphaerae bacterium]